MNVLTRLKVARNMDYHQQMADHYAEQAETARSKEATEGAAARGTEGGGSTRTVVTEEEYLASLHADIAQQLRDVLDVGGPPVIIGTTPPIIRETGPIIESRSSRRQVH